MDGGYGQGAYRRRRETTEELEAEFDALMVEIESNDDDGFAGKQYGSQANQGQLNKLQGLCERFIKQVFDDGSLADCPKLGAWRNRSAALFADMIAMKNVCLKQAEEGADDSQYGGGKPENPEKPADAYPSKPDATKPPKKPAYNNKPNAKKP